MTESEILQSYSNIAQVVLSLFSTFFAVVSAYIVALYYFLHKAPLAMRLLAFFLLTVALLFLGSIGFTMQQAWVGLIVAWRKLASPATGIATLGDPIGISSLLHAEGYKLGLALSWLTAGISYVALAHMTFFHRWGSPAVSGDRRQDNGEEERQ